MEPTKQIDLTWLIPEFSLCVLFENILYERLGKKQEIQVPNDISM